MSGCRARHLDILEDILDILRLGRVEKTLLRNSFPLSLRIAGLQNSSEKKENQGEEEGIKYGAQKSQCVWPKGRAGTGSVNINDGARNEHGIDRCVHRLSNIAADRRIREKVKERNVCCNRSIKRFS
jgi:hypothetical protein